MSILHLFQDWTQTSKTCCCEGRADLLWFNGATSGTVTSPDPGARSQHYCSPHPTHPAGGAACGLYCIHPCTVFIPDPRVVTAAARGRALRCVFAALFPQAEPSGQAAAIQLCCALYDL